MKMGSIISSDSEKESYCISTNVEPFYWKSLNLFGVAYNLRFPLQFEVGLNVLKYISVGPLFLLHFVVDVHFSRSKVARSAGVKV